MAEPTSKTEIVKREANEYAITIKEAVIGGGANTYVIPIPADSEWRGWPVMLRAAVLKQGNPAWQPLPLPTILHAIMYAESLGLDIVAGDVYQVNGRLSTTTGAKIKHAIRVLGEKLRGFDVQIRELEDAVDLAGKQGSYSGPDLEATVTVLLVGWEKPHIYRAKLSSWFEGSNPNWVKRPEYMLRRNALGHALEEIAPMGAAEPEEAPPLPSMGIAEIVAKETANAKQ